MVCAGADPYELHASVSVDMDMSMQREVFSALETVAADGIYSKPDRFIAA